MGCGGCVEVQFRALKFRKQEANLLEDMKQTVMKMRDNTRKDLQTRGLRQRQRIEIASRTYLSRTIK